MLKVAVLVLLVRGFKLLWITKGRIYFTLYFKALTEGERMYTIYIGD